MNGWAVILWRAQIVGIVPRDLPRRALCPFKRMANRLRGGDPVNVGHHHEIAGLENRAPQPPSTENKFNGLLLKDKLLAYELKLDCRRSWITQRLFAFEAA